jgi:hypothetical protein
MIRKNDIISEHLPYEIHMLRHAYDKLQSSSHGQATDNGLIECFCLHARNLLDFFRDQKHSNYAVAREFTTASYNPFDGTNPKSSGGLYGKLNDQITHLSYRRTNNPAAKIGPDERVFLKNLIEKEIDNFSNHVDGAYRPLWKVQAEAPVSTPVGPSGTTSTPHITTVGATGPIGC